MLRDQRRRSSCTDFVGWSGWNPAQWEWGHSHIQLVREAVLASHKVAIG